MAAARDIMTFREMGEWAFLSEDGSWMIRRPRGADEGWIVDLAGQATDDDWHLLHTEAAATLSVVFTTVRQAAEALAAALERQVRVGQRWEHKHDGRTVQVTRIDRGGGGPDGTVFVRDVATDERWSPGDFRVTYRRVA